MTEPKIIDPNLVCITSMRGGEPFSRVEKILIFREISEYWYIRFSNNIEKKYPRLELNITYSCLNDDEVKNCLSYLREIASINELKNDDKKVLLEKQYDKLNFAGMDTVMSAYLNPAKYKA